MRQYRIYTEAKPNVEALASKIFDGFTVYKAVGYWKGKKESSIVIEVLSESLDIDATEYKVNHLVSVIKRVNEQEAVLVSVQDIKITLS